MIAEYYFLPTYNIDIMLCPVESGILKKDSLSIKAFSLNNIIMMHTICCAPEKQIFIGSTYKSVKVVLLVRWRNGNH